MSHRLMFRDEAQLVEHLHRLVADGLAGGYLNVSCGPDYWMQFVKNKPNYIRRVDTPLPEHLFWNVAANDTLPPSRQLTDLQVAQMRMLGFVYPSSPHPDYQIYATGFVRIVDQLDRETLAALAHTSCHVFANIYRCPAGARLRFELEPYGIR